MPVYLCNMYPQNQKITEEGTRIQVNQNNLLHKQLTDQKWSNMLQTTLLLRKQTLTL